MFCSDTFIRIHCNRQCCEEYEECSFGNWSADWCIPKTTPKKLGFEESSRGLVLTSSSLQDSAPVMANVSMAFTRPGLCMLLLADHGMLSPNLLSQSIAVIPQPQPPTDHYLGSMTPWICHSDLLCITAIAPGWPAKYWVLALSQHGSQAVAYTQMPGIISGVMNIDMRCIHVLQVNAGNWTCARYFCSTEDCSCQATWKICAACQSYIQSFLVVNMPRPQTLLKTMESSEA